MKRLPSYLKGLVESRARAAGDIERLEQLRRLLNDELAAAQLKVQAADTLIRDFNSSLEPSQIQPIRPRRGRYGEVRDAVRQVLREAAPAAVSTSELALLVSQKAKLQFQCESEFRKWADNTLRRELRKQALVGTIERIPVVGEENRWRTVATNCARTLHELGALSSSEMERAA